MKKLYAYRGELPCYFCGRPGPSTKEHVPPSVFFSEVKCDSITVPSCHEHNSGKSGTDMAIITSLVRGIHSLEYKRILPSSGDLVRSTIEKIKRRYNQTKNDIYVQKFKGDSSSNQEIELAVTRSHVDIRGWSVQLTAGLVWSVIGRSAVDWSRAWAWSPSQYDSASVSASEAASNSEAAAEVEASGTWRAGWSARPRPYPRQLYSFKVRQSASAGGAECTMIFRHSFFERYQIYVQFFLPEDISHDINEFLGKELPPDRKILPWIKGIAKDASGG